MSDPELTAEIVWADKALLALYLELPEAVAEDFIPRIGKLMHALATLETKCLTWKQLRGELWNEWTEGQPDSTLGEFFDRAASRLLPYIATEVQHQLR